MTSRPGRERGTTSLLIVGFAVVVLLTVAVAVDASAAYLRRQGLDALADGTALAAVDGIQGRQVYESGLGEHAQIDPDVAREYAAAYLRASGATATYPGLTLTVESTADRVVVRLAAPLRLPLTPPGWEHRPVVTATAAAFVEVSR